MRMRFGLGMNSDHTLEEVGQQFSVTREEFGRLRPRHCGSSNTQAGQGSSGASSIVDVPGRAACDMNAMIVGRVHGRESIRLRARDFSLSEF